MSEIPLQPTSLDVWSNKYQLKSDSGEVIDKTVDCTYKRVAKDLAKNEEDSIKWEKEFLWALRNGATPAGRIMSNAGAGVHKPATSTINCTVSRTVDDSLVGIGKAVADSILTLGAGCGIGYEFSTLRPKDAFIVGAGANTSGPLPFMDIFDKACFTIMSAGGRRGAQMATFAVWHPDVEEFIKAKREDGRFRQFNCSLLIDDDFMEAVKNNGSWDLVFPIKSNEMVSPNDVVVKKLFWDEDYCRSQNYRVENGLIACKLYKTINAKDLWDTIMKSTYDFAEPGFLLVDQINKMNNNYFCETIRATNPCGEQPLPPEGSCLLGSINLTKCVKNPFTDNAKFDWEKYYKLVEVFTRMLDNVVDDSNLPLEGQRKEILSKRRHGMGYLGLGSAMTMLGMTYGDKASIKFTEQVSKILAVIGYTVGVDLAIEKGEAPIMKEKFGEFTGRDMWLESRYMQKIWEIDPYLYKRAIKYGCRFTHHCSIAPTGTISLSLSNNTSNGIEPTFAHHYTRNMILTGKKTKVAVDVYSYEMLAYKNLTGDTEVPKWFSTTENVTWKQHVDIQAAAQKWIDSSISKTINVPTDMDFATFKDVYMYAYDCGLKGVTTFRFNPEAFQGVLVKAEDLENTKYFFANDAGETFTLSGNEMIDYNGDECTAANLYDSLKEGYYGKF